MQELRCSVYVLLYCRLYNACGAASQKLRCSVDRARAMNADFGPRVKQLFDIEREAALDAAQSGIYIGNIAVV